MYKSKTVIRGSLTALLLASNLGLANELDYEFRAGVGHTDNVARTEVDGIDETVGVVGVDLSYEHVSSHIDLNVDGDVEFRHYSDDTFDDDTFGSINSDLVFKLSPRFFTWGAEYRFGHVVTDPFAAENPQTRERVNTIATGPDIAIPFGGANSLGLNSRIASNNFSETDIDNDSLNGRVSYTRALSRSRNISLNVSATRVDFDNTVLNSSFDRQSAFFAFSSQNSRGSVEISLGVNELHDQGVVRDGELIDFTFNRELTSSTSFSISADRQLTFAGELFDDLQQPGDTFQDARDIAGVADPLEVTRANAAYRYERNTNSLFVSVAARSDEFVNETDLDRSRLTILVGGIRRLGSTWRLNYSASVGKTKFDASPRQDDELSMALGLRRQLTQSLWLSVDLRHNDRSSNEAGAGYTENVGFLTLRYSR